MKTFMICLPLIAALISGPVMADYKRHKLQHRDHFYDYGRVTSAEPIIEIVKHRRPTQCDHTRPYNRGKKHRRQQNHSATPAVLGAIIGAAIGNELGHKKSNKRVGAVAGGILGGAIGTDIERKKRQEYSPEWEHSEQAYRCDQPHYRVHREERVVGYDVQYRYRGKHYRTQTQQHPGRRIQLKLSLEPVWG